MEAEARRVKAEMKKAKDEETNRIRQEKELERRARKEASRRAKEDAAKVKEQALLEADAARSAVQLQLALMEEDVAYPTSTQAVVCHR